MSKWIKRKPRPCRTPCRSGQMCDSPQSLPRVPSCNEGAIQFKSHEAAALTCLFCHLLLHSFLHLLSPVPLSAFKTLNIKDLTLPHQRQGPGGDTSSATWVPPMTSVNTSCASTTLVRSCCQKSFLLWTHLSAAWSLRGRVRALS